MAAAEGAESGTEPGREAGLGSAPPEAVVPILGGVRPEAAEAGLVAQQGGGGLVAGGVVVVATQQPGCGLGVEPAGQTAGRAGGGGDQAVRRQSGRGQQDGGEGVEGTFDEQQGGEGGGPGGQPEAAAVAAGARGQGLEGGAIGARAGADEFGPGGGAGAVAAEKDGIAPPVGEEGAGMVLNSALFRREIFRLFRHWESENFQIICDV